MFRPSNRQTGKNMENGKYIHFVLLSFFLLAAAQNQFTLLQAAEIIIDGDAYIMDEAERSRDITFTGAGGTIYVKTNQMWDDDITTNAAGILNIDAARIFISNGGLAGSGDFTKTGNGTFLYNGTSTHTGTMSIVAGTLGGVGTLRTVVIEDGATLAPGTGRNSVESITIDNLTLENNSTLKMRIDDAGHTDEIIITSVPTINAGAKLVLDALSGDYTTVPQVYDSGFLKDDIGGILDASGLSPELEQKFLTLDLSGWTGLNQKFTIVRDADFFKNYNPETHNQWEVAQALDNAISSGPWKAMTRMSKSTDPVAVRAAYDEMLPGLKANSMMLGQWQTSRYGLNHLDLTNCGVSQENGVWLEFIHQTTNFDGDANNNDYGISRTGFIIGSEERRVDVTYGFFVGYSLPYLYDHGNKVKANDLQFGFYGGSKVNDILETKLFVGYGHQGYKSRRFLHSPLLVQPGEENRIKGDHTGDSMSMSLEFAVPIQSGFFNLRPLFAIDSDLTWQYGFAETGTTGVELWYDRNFLNRSFLRTGLTAQLGSVGDCDPIALTGRFYYGYQAFGDSYPMARSKFATETTSHRMEVYGVDTGKSYVDLGVGLRWNIDSNRSFYGDYDFTAFSNSTAHWGSFGYMQKW